MTQRRGLRVNHGRIDRHAAAQVLLEVGVGLGGRTARKESMALPST